MRHLTQLDEEKKKKAAEAKTENAAEESKKVDSLELPKSARMQNTNESPRKETAMTDQNESYMAPSIDHGDERP